MTRRIDSPLTPADRELHALLDRGMPRFTMISGAGSGKTTSLVKALAHIVETRGGELRRQGQQVACITYTEVAAREIYSDLAETPLAHVSTIHSFLWTVIKPFQNDIRAWVADDIRRIIDKERATAATKSGMTKQRAEDRAARYETILAELPSVQEFRYGTGRDYAQGLLGHSEVLAMVPKLIMDKPLLAKLVARRFPFVLVDESQDTFAEVVNALRHIADKQPNFALGFFGDPMQKIYTTGVGTIHVPEGPNGWSALTKPENFRSSLRVLELINAIRASAGDPTGPGIGARRSRPVRWRTHVRGPSREREPLRVPQAHASVAARSIRNRSVGRPRRPDVPQDPRHRAPDGRSQARVRRTLRRVSRQPNAARRLRRRNRMAPHGLPGVHPPARRSGRQCSPPADPAAHEG